MEKFLKSFEGAIPIIGIGYLYPRFQIHFNLNEIDFFLFPSLNTNFQIESLNILNINESKRLSKKL